MKHRYGGAIVAASVGLVFAILFYGTVGYSIFNQRRIIDQLRVWSFTPTAAIAEQMRRDDMSAEGRFLYLASHPKVESKRDFNETCSAVTTDTSVLGCYLESSKRIYLYHETDVRLDGTEEVMAAHEMLRAAWDRMSPAEHTALLVPLNDVLTTNDDGGIDLSDRMTAIHKHDPKDADGELYAMIGSEVPDVGKVLEASYAKYFVKRSTVTDLAAHARAYTVALELKVNTLVATMTALGDNIDDSVANFNAAVSALDSDIDTFNARAERLGGFSSVAQFNVARQGLIDRENALNATATQINAQVDTFNADLTTLKGLDKTAAGLMKSLNVTLDAVPDTLSA